MINRLLKSARRERGAALLETAIALPIVMLIAVAIIEFGAAFQTWQVLTNAAREGARLAVLPSTNEAAVTDRVQAYMEAGSLRAADDADIDIDQNTTISIGAGTASASRVEITYPYEFVALNPVARIVVPDTTLGEALTMTATATMRNE
jgi:Flp pilus assembly protein TadG